MTMTIKSHIDAAFTASEAAHFALLDCRSASCLADAKLAHFECGRQATLALVAMVNSEHAKDAVRASDRADRSERFAAAVVGRMVTFG